IAKQVIRVKRNRLLAGIRTNRDACSVHLVEDYVERSDQNGYNRQYNGMDRKEPFEAFFGYEFTSTEYLHHDFAYQRDRPGDFRTDLRGEVGRSIPREQITG